MKKLITFALNICIIISMLIPTGTAEGMATQIVANVDKPVSSSGLFRTSVQIEQAYDLTRLEELGVSILEQGETWAVVLVTETQLEALARLGLEPQASNDLSVLVESNAESTPWLANSLEGSLEQAVSMMSMKGNNPDDSLNSDTDLKAIVSSFSVEQLSGILALPGDDNDADGLTDTQESWWCTDPNNPDTDSDGRTDGEEIQALKDWMGNRLASAPGETPWASWPFNPSTCPDKDYDSIPNLAERWELGLNMDLESTDRDKFDDGQEVFGVTNCPGGDNNCGYGDLPRSSDAGYVGHTMPAWVKAPGNHPLVAAFPMPDVSIDESSLHVQTVTVITTDHEISSGTEKTYSTSETNGTSTSKTDTVTWNNWEENSSTQYNYQSSAIVNPNNIELNQPTATKKKPSRVTNTSVTKQISNGFSLADQILDIASIPLKAWDIGQQYGEGLNKAIYVGARMVDDVRTGRGMQWPVNYFEEYDEMEANSQKCYSNCGEGLSSVDAIDGMCYQDTEGQNYNTARSGRSTFVSGQDIFSQRYYPISYPVPKIDSTTTSTSGNSWGESQSTTNTEYEEHTITNGEAFSTAESWGDATAVDSAHAADFWFTYRIKNAGTEYAKELSNLTFNLYIDNNKNPIYTYYVAEDLGGDGKFYNLLPDEEHIYTSRRIPLTLEQIKSIDTGATIRVVVEDFSYGSDELFYENAAGANINISIDDGMDDGDENIDNYVIPIWEGETVLDVIGRYFPIETDANNNLFAFWTPEMRSTIPEWCMDPRLLGSGTQTILWCKHSLSTSEWWNVYSESMGEGSEGYQDTLAAPGGYALFRFNKDTDFDGYSDRSEQYAGTSPIDLADFPNPELIAGVNSIRTNNNVISTLSLLNMGLYDAYGIEAVMIAPDDTITINNNTVGGSGRVRAGKSVIVGSQITAPVMGYWTGTAKPTSLGYYSGSIDRIYTFTVNCANPGGCDISSGDWNINWVDSQGISGTLDFGNGYNSPNPLQVGNYGLKVGLITGRVYEGNTFSLQTLKPRDTFQYTINSEPYTPPIVIVSYNDPQGNHRFMLPADAMSLATPTDDLLAFSGEMLDIRGVEIVTGEPLTPGVNNTSLVVDNPTNVTLANANLFLEFIDSQGVVVEEVSSTQDLLSGPSVVDIAWDTVNFDPAYDPEQDYIVMAFWTDYEGNILDVVGRPLSSFQADPQAQFAMSESDTIWNIGTVSQGTLLQRRFTFANTGEREMLTFVEAPAGLSVSQVGSREVNVADQTSYDIVLNTEEFTVGTFSQIVTIHTSDPNNATRTVQVTGTITEGVADVPTGVEERPLDYTVNILGEYSQGEEYEYIHNLAPNPQNLHPCFVFDQNRTFPPLGFGRYCGEFGESTIPYRVFGTGQDGDKLVTSNPTYIDNDRTYLISSASSGQPVLLVANATNLNVNTELLIIQMQGTNAGIYEFGTIANKTGNTLNLGANLSNTYTVGGSSKVQVIPVPNYRNVTIQNGSRLTSHPWDGNTGGILVFRASGVVQVQSSGIIDVSSLGFRGGPQNNTSSGGIQGEGQNGYGVRSTSSNGMGAGGGCSNGYGNPAGGGGGAYGSNGALGGVGLNNGCLTPGSAGISSGTSNLSNIILLGGGGGSGGGKYNDGPLNYGGGGGVGGGVAIVFGRILTLSGGIHSNGSNGLTGVEGGRGANGGGGSGGAIFIVSQFANIGNDLVKAQQGLGGQYAPNHESNGGNGGTGRINILYQTLTGTTSMPAAVYVQTNFYNAEQVELSPFTTTRLFIPVAFTDGMTYQVQYGRRFEFDNTGEQTDVFRLNSSTYAISMVDVLISDVGIGSLTISLDIGNDGSTDYTWTGNVTDSIALEDLQLAPAFNRWWAANGRPTSGTMDVPVKVTLSKAGQVLLTDLKVNTSGSSLRFVQMGSATYDNLTLDYTLIGASGPITVGLDIGDNGSVDAVYTAEAPADPEFVTSTDLSTFFNAYLSDKTGPVNVPIRFHLPDGVSVQLNDFTAVKTGSLDVGLSAGDIQLPSEAPTEGAIVPVTVTLHNTGSLPSGSVVASFYATLPDSGDWYIGSALVNTVPGNGSAEASINWDTLGFTGDTTVKVVVDPYMRLAEADEANNVAQASLVIRTRPDLTATSFELSDSEPVVGKAVTVFLTEANQGQTDALVSVVSVYEGSPAEGGTLLGEGTVEVMGGSSAILEFSWVPSSTGWHRLFVVSDEDKQVFESDEANNLSWLDVYVGVAGPLLLDSGTASDQIYSAVSGYGYIDINQADDIAACGLNNLPEETFRRDPDGEVVYQFDHLQPGHFYHLDITLFECDGAGRQETIWVDDNLISSVEDLGDGQVHGLSLRLDPALYADRTVKVTIHADGIDGAVVSSVNLHDIDYRYADAGGGADLQFPGTRVFGWLDGAPIITWGTLPYKSVRVDQSDNNIRYQFDELDPSKRYNVHFTFWQPSGTARVQKVQIDGVDTGDTVNTGDYLLHQVVAAVPINAYNSDGSVVVSIVRTNALTGAMINEIALEEETINTSVGCVVNETPYFSETYGSVLIEDLNAPVGSIIQAVSPRGDTVGCFTVTDGGLYGFMRVYGEDNSAVPAIPGMRAGEMVGFKVNGAPAVATPLYYWNDDHAAHNINLNAGNISGQSILLQPGWNLISFNVEPPAPIVSSVLQSINGNYDRVLSENGVYVPALPDPFNTLRELHSASGYYLRVTSATSVNLLVEGIAQPCSLPKELHAGWNWIGAPCTITETGTALQSISGHYQRVLGLNKTYDPALPAFSTLKNLTPGEGYLIYITDPVTLTYPAGTLLITDDVLEVEPACENVLPTPFVTLIYGDVRWMGKKAPVGSLVEIITPRGEVAGCGMVEENGTLPLTQVYGADHGSISGFNDGEELLIRINGIDVVETFDFVWHDDKAPHWIQPEVVGYSVYLPSVLN